MWVRCFTAGVSSWATLALWLPSKGPWYIEDFINISTLYNITKLPLHSIIPKVII